MSNRPRIMVVDDELGPRESLRMLLMDNYEVLTAENGKIAMEYLNHGGVDLAILDIRMPDINGIDLLAQIKAKAPDTEVVMITAYASVNTATNAMRYGAFDYLIKPFDRESVDNVVKKGLSRRKRSLENQKKITKLQMVNKTLKNEIEHAYQNIQRHYKETVDSLIEVIDAKDSYTKGHQERVAILAVRFGKALGLSNEEINLIRQAALLHDIGKIGVPEHILNKKDTLDPDEFEFIKQHPAIGARIISRVQFLKDVVPIVLHHHEKYQGTGYPSGLKGEQIPLGARIITIADSIDAMLSERPYARAKSMEMVREQLITGSGTHFDPLLVEIALKMDFTSRENIWGPLQN